MNTLKESIVPVSTERVSEIDPFAIVIQRIITASKGLNHEVNKERLQYVLELIANEFREQGLFSEEHPHFTKYNGSARRLIQSSHLLYKLRKTAKLKPSAKIDVEAALGQRVFNQTKSALTLIIEHHKQSAETNIDTISNDIKSELMLRSIAYIVSNEYLDWAIGLEETERAEALDHFDKLFNSLSPKIILTLDLGEAGLGTLGLDIPISVGNLLYCLHKGKKAPLKAKKKIAKIHVIDASISQLSEALLAYTTGGLGLPLSVLADFLYKANRKSLEIMLDVFQALITVERMKGFSTSRFENTLANCKDEVTQQQGAGIIEMWKVFASDFLNKRLTGKTTPKQLPPTK